MLDSQYIQFVGVKTLNPSSFCDFLIHQRPLWYNDRHLNFFWVPEVGCDHDGRMEQDLAAFSSVEIGHAPHCNWVEKTHIPVVNISSIFLGKMWHKCGRNPNFLSYSSNPSFWSWKDSRGFNKSRDALAENTKHFNMKLWGWMEIQLSNMAICWNT